MKFISLKIIALFLSTPLFAAEFVELVTPSNIRNSINFYGQKNIVGFLNTGSVVEILSETKLNSGAYALKIKVSSPSEKIDLNNNAPIYIWKSESNHPKSVTESGTTCDNTECENATSSTNNDNINDLTNINQKIEEQDSQPADTSTPNVTSAEITYQNSDFDNYSNSKEVNNVVKYLENKMYRKGRIKGKCYRVVKYALAYKESLIPKWFSSRSAKFAVNDLKKYGFINLLDDPKYKEVMKDPKNAPRGTVLVYLTNQALHKNGHIEIKMDHGIQSRYGYGETAQTPITETGGKRAKYYKLIGVMIKPEIKD